VGGARRDFQQGFFEGSSPGWQRSILTKNLESRVNIKNARWITAHVYKVRPRKDKRGVDLIRDALPFGRLCYGGPDAINDAIGYATFRSRSHHAVIRVYNDADNVIETHESKRRFQRVVSVRHVRKRAAMP
jgi:hypothetical protein